jgi:hypothetical protein
MIHQERDVISSRLSEQPAPRPLGERKKISEPAPFAFGFGGASPMRLHFQCEAAGAASLRAPSTIERAPSPRIRPPESNTNRSQDARAASGI